MNETIIYNFQFDKVFTLFGTLLALAVVFTLIITEQGVYFF